MRNPFARKASAKSDVVLIQPFQGSTPSYPPRNWNAYAMEGYAGNAIIYACVTAKASSASEIHLKAQQLIRDEWVDADDETTPTSKATDCQSLLDQPNPHQDQTEWVEELIMNREVAGNSFSQIELSASGQPVALWHLRPDMVSVIPDPQKLIGGYLYNPGRPVPLKVEEVIHSKLGPDPKNRLMGLSPIAVIAKEVDADGAATDFLKGFFDRGGVPAWAAMFKSKIDLKDAVQFKGKWAEEFSVGQGGNPHGVAALNANEVSLVKVGAGTSNRELGLTDLRMVTDARICGVYRVHPQIAFSILGFIHPTYAQAAMAEEIMWSQTLLPMYKRIAGKLTMCLRRYYGDDIRIICDTSDVSALQEDEMAKWKRHLDAAMNGFETREEFRDAVGLPKDPDGVFLVPYRVIEQVPGEPLSPEVRVNETVPATLEQLLAQERQDEGDGNAKIPPSAPVAPPTPRARLAAPQKALELNPPQYTGVMVALMVPPAVAAQLAMSGGEDASELHLTLAFLGDSTEMTEHQINGVLNAARKVAAEFAPISGLVSGVGLFNGKDGKDVIYASYDAPSLPGVRHALITALKNAAMPARTDHGFTPHITLCYISSGSKFHMPSVPSTPLTFASLTVAVAGQHHTFPFTGMSDGKALALVEHKVSPAAERYIVRMEKLRRDLATNVEPHLAEYFAGLRERVIARTRGQQHAALSIHLQTKGDYPFDANDLVPKSEDHKLWLILAPLITDAIESGWETAGDAFDMDEPYTPDAAEVAGYVREAAKSRPQMINDATRGAIATALAIGAQRGYSAQQLADGVEADGFKGLGAIVSELYDGRNLAIALNEIRIAAEIGAIGLYKAAGIEMVEMSDGVMDGPCAERNGQVVTLGHAQAELMREHPNGTLSLTPVSGVGAL